AVESVTWRSSRWVAYPSSAEFWVGEAAKCRAAARSMRGGKVAASVVQRTETMVAGPVVGAEPSQLALVSAPDNVVPLRVLPGGGGTQEPDNGEEGDDGDADAPPAERVLDKVVREYQGVSPVEGQLMRYPMPAIPAHVPAVEDARTEWHKVLPPIANRHTEKHVQHEWIFSATPGLSQVA